MPVPSNILHMGGRNFYAVRIPQEAQANGKHLALHFSVAASPNPVITLWYTALATSCTPAAIYFIPEAACRRRAGFLTRICVEMQELAAAAIVLVSSPVRALLR